MDREKNVLNFIQDFGCAKLEHLQVIFDDRKNNFKFLLSTGMVSKKEDIFIHKTKRMDQKMLIALDILCKYKNRYDKFYLGNTPVQIIFTSKKKQIYNIIVADDENKKGIVKMVNSYPLAISEADKLILAFPDATQYENIECDMIPILYCTYPEYEIIQ